MLSSNLTCQALLTKTLEKTLLIYIMLMFKQAFDYLFSIWSFLHFIILFLINKCFINNYTNFIKYSFVHFNTEFKC